MSLLLEKPVYVIQGLISFQFCSCGSVISSHEPYFPDISPPASLVKGNCCNMHMRMLPLVSGPAECLSCHWCPGLQSSYFVSPARPTSHPDWLKKSPYVANNPSGLPFWLAKRPTGVLVASNQVPDSRPVPEFFGFPSSNTE